MVSLLGASNIKSDQFFNMKGLSKAAVEKLELSVKKSKETLALADQLQTMRDTAKTLHKLEMSLKSGSSIGSRILDLYS